MGDTQSPVEAVPAACTFRAGNSEFQCEKKSVLVGKVVDITICSEAGRAVAGLASVCDGVSETQSHLEGFT